MCKGNRDKKRLNQERSKTLKKTHIKSDLMIKSTPSVSINNTSNEIYKMRNADELIAKNIKNNLFVRTDFTQKCTLEWPGVLFSGFPSKIKINGSFTRHRSKL